MQDLYGNTVKEILTTDTMRNKASEQQVSGKHYKDMAIQPMYFSYKNKLDPLQHTIIKYVCRFRDKAGKIDLEKARHCIDLLIEYEYPE